MTNQDHLKISRVNQKFNLAVLILASKYCFSRMVETTLIFSPTSKMLSIYKSGKSFWSKKVRKSLHGL